MKRVIALAFLAALLLPSYASAQITGTFKDGAGNTLGYTISKPAQNATYGWDNIPVDVNVAMSPYKLKEIRVQLWHWDPVNNKESVQATGYQTTLTSTPSTAPIAPFSVRTTGTANYTGPIGGPLPYVLKFIVVNESGATVGSFFGKPFNVQ